MPFFSVIIPTYNRAHILINTLQSLKGQTLSDWECVVVDDGSTDNTKEMVELICKKDSRVRYIYQNNAERSVARNNGIIHSSGTYICFLDSDDEFLPNHLEVLHDVIKKKDYPKALFFTSAVFKQNNNLWNSEIMEMNVSPLEYMLQNPIIPARVCVHKEILNEYRFREDIVIVEDQVLWATIANYYPVFQIKQHTVIYNLHEDNSINIKKNCFKPRLEGLKLFFSQKDMQGVVPKKLQKRLLSDCYLGIARYYAFKKKYLMYAFNVLVSIFIDPLTIRTKSKIHMIFFPGKHTV